MESFSGLVLAFFLVVLSSGFPILQAYRHIYVGGRDGWVLNPSQNYEQWAGRTRFQVNDTLVFKYRKGEDSVLQVKKEDYYSCNGSSPIRRMGSGESVFKLEMSGPFYFISGADGHCQKGQKLVVVVLAVRHKSSPSPSMQPISPPQKSPSPFPVSPSPSPSMPPKTPSPAPYHAPSPSPSMAPKSPSPTPSHEPSSSSEPSQSPSPSDETPVPSPPSPDEEGVSPAPVPSQHKSGSSALSSALGLLVALTTAGVGAFLG